MRRFHVHQALRAARLSPFDADALLGGVVLIFAAVAVAVIAGDAGGLARRVGTVGLAALVLSAASRGARHYRAGVTASLPASVARVPVRTRPLRVVGVVTVALALGLPLAAGVALVGLVEWGWLFASSVLLLGSTAMFVTWVTETRRGEEPYTTAPATAAELLRRLCMRADMRVPRIVVTPGPMAIAWTAGRRIHVSRPLLRLLDDAELEGVLAHELAHLAHRDAAVVEICAAPSRVLLACARTLSGWLVGLVRRGVAFIPGGTWVTSALAAVAALGVPPTFALGWTARLSVLGMSRAREFAADATAAALTGRPSALASALMKLERQRDWTPRADLRQAEAYAVLCIVGTHRSRLGRLFSTHPPTAARVKRLAALESRIQARGL